MAAVIRVKRLLEDEPAEALILNCKRRKLDDEGQENASSELSTVWKFAATLKSQDEDVLKHIKKPTKEFAKEQYKKHLVNVNEKIRNEFKNASKSNRLKVVNLHRSQLDDAEADNKDGNITIVDVEASEEKKETDSSNSESKFVYDLYYTNADDFQTDFDYNDCSIHPLSEELVYAARTDGNSSDDDSEDSNAENNWRNDYPDESDMESITEDDMIEALNRVDLNKDYELSSDEGEESYVYNTEGTVDDFEEEVDQEDVVRHGEMYARFKAKNKNVETTGLDSSFYYGDIDEEEYYY